MNATDHGRSTAGNREDAEHNYSYDADALGYTEVDGTDEAASYAIVTGERAVPGAADLPDTRRRRPGALPEDYPVEAELPGFREGEMPRRHAGDPMPTYDTGQRRAQVGADGALPVYTTRERPTVGADGSLPEFTDRDRCRSQPDEPPLDGELDDAGQWGEIADAGKESESRERRGPLGRFRRRQQR